MFKAELKALKRVVGKILKPAPKLSFSQYIGIALGGINKVYNYFLNNREGAIYIGNQNRVSLKFDFSRGEWLLGGKKVEKGKPFKIDGNKFVWDIENLSTAPYVMFQYKGKAKQFIALPETKITIGRGGNSDIQIEDINVSHKHATISCYRLENKLLLTLSEESSVRNRLSINDQKLKPGESYVLRSSERKLKIGKSSFILKIKKNALFMLEI